MLAIEPMVNAGKPAVQVLADRWTAVTKDKASAHFEHTVAVTDDGPGVDAAGRGGREADGRRNGRRIDGWRRRSELLPSRGSGEARSGHQVTAHRRARGTEFRPLSSGDRVRVELSPHDPRRGGSSRHCERRVGSLEKR